MKYFVNIHNADELRKAFGAYCMTMHPDKGGNEEDFKIMLNEYEQAARNLDGTKQSRKTAEDVRREEEERREAERQAEEARRRYEREKEEERKAREAARPDYEKRCKKWAHLMEDLKPYREAVTAASQKKSEAGRAHGWRSPEYKEAEKATRAARTAENAARRRNLLKMAQTAFKGVKFSLKYDDGWGGGYTLSWEDGPSVQEMEAATDYGLFVSMWDTFDGMTDCAGVESSMFTDFAQKYNGNAGKVEFSRTISEANRKKLEDVLKQFAPDLGKNEDPETRRRYNLDEYEDIKVSFDADQLREILRIFGADFDKLNKNRAFRYMYAFSSHSLAGWVKNLAEYLTFKTDEEKKQEKQAQPAQFVPRYGETLRTLHKLTGITLGEPDGGKEGIYFWQRGKDRGTGVRLSILEAVAAMEKGESVYFGAFYEGPKYTSAWGWGKDNGGYKVQKARAEKFAAAGYTLKGAGHLSPNSFVSIDAISTETAAAIRAELADIEKQRQQWEQEQTAKASEKAEKRTKASKPTNSKPETKQADSDRDGVDMTAAPAEGLRLIDTAEGVAVVADDWKTTYFNKKYIKAHGAHWNKERKQWEATDPQDIDSLRAWFGLSEPQGEPEPQAEAEPQAEQPAADLSPLVEAVADLLQTFARIMQEAAKWEGVTIPAATLERWQQEATDGSTTAAARFAEVCACLGCLTPDSRQQFDGLGAIFWALAEQLRNGTDAATIKPAADYARAQLFDLIDKTQTPNQARALREAFQSFREAA